MTFPSERLERLLARIVVLLLLFVPAAPGAAQATRPAQPRNSDRKSGPQPPDSVQFTREIVYGKGGGEDLKLDLSRPKQSAESAKPLPCVVVIHGGGWSAGDKADNDNVTWELAARGFVAATVGYRLAPAHRFPAQIQDVKCAVRFLRANADKYGLDPDRIGAVGFSAGAHLAMMLGTTSPADGLEGDGGWPDASSKVQAVVSFFGPTDLTAADIPEISKGILSTFLGGSLADKHDLYVQASPASHVTKDSAPMLLFQGTADPLIPATQAYRMADAMTKAGVKGRVELLIGASHGWGGADLKRTAEETFAFFNEMLRSGR